MKNLIAQQPIQIAPSGGFKGLGTGNLANPGNGVDAFVTFISGTIAVLTVVAIIWFIFVFITGAIGIISSGGDKQALETAKKKITTAIIGLVVVLLAIVIINIIGTVLGIPNILNISQLLCKPLGTCP
jgi:ABC-type dipeptide/oligopeptide/nickel transport system permease subunit